MDQSSFLLKGILFSLLIFTGCTRQETSSVFEGHFKRYPEIRKKYLYQSVLRLANVNNDPNFEKLIRDVDKISIFLPPNERAGYEVARLRSEIRENNYEELIDIRTAQQERISLWVNESLQKPHYIGLLDTAGDDYVFEVDGQINLEYIASVAMADQASLRQLLK